MTEHPSDHLAIYAAESAALAATDWERWINRVESLMQHDADSDLGEKGYSLDTFLDMYEAGVTPEAASVRIVGAVFTTPDGLVYRLVAAMRSPAYAGYAEQYDVVGPSVEGLDRRRSLPDNAVLVWAPDRGVSAVATCTHCGRLVGFETVTTDEWRASAHCPSCLVGLADPRPCQGRNPNICVAEGCYGEACR